MNTDQQQAEQAAEAIVNQILHLPECRSSYAFADPDVPSAMRKTALAALKWRAANPPEVSGDLKERVAKILSGTKYRFPLATKKFNGREVVTDAIYCVDIAAAAEKIAADMAQHLAEKDDTLSKAVALIDEREAEIEALKNDLKPYMIERSARAGAFTDYERSIEALEAENERLQRFPMWLAENGWTWEADCDAFMQLRKNPAPIKILEDMLDLFRKETGRG